MRDPGFRRSVVVAVGIDAYAAPIPPLRTAVADAHAIANLLHERYEFDRHVRENGAATAAGVLLLLNRLARILDTRDRLVFYFAGHGVAVDCDDGPQGFVLPSDARAADTSTFLAMRQLHDALVAIPCRHLLVILDCCFAGAFRWSSKRDLSVAPKRLYRERYDQFVEHPARQALTSSAHDQRAADFLPGVRLGERGDGNAHSPFAALLLDGLAGAADARWEGRRGDGIITASELYLYVRTQLGSQTVGLWPLPSYDRGEFSFVADDVAPLDALPARAQNPYLGLRAYDTADEHRFFGRDELTVRLAARVASSRLTVALGASGIGKSSLARAGLVPELERKHWQVAVVSPGTDPVVALERATARLGAASPALLVVDQLEELLTAPHTPATIDAFFTALAARPSQIHVVLVVRLDFEPSFEPSRRVGWNDGRFLVPAMTGAELREAIIGPAAEIGCSFDPPNLVDELADEVVQMPQALPLLSFTLDQIYESYVARAPLDRVLRRKDYDARGGVAGALRNRADAVYHELCRNGRELVARRLLLRMVSLEGGEIARRRVRGPELECNTDEAQADQQAVIAALAAARLVVVGNEEVEPAHDELVRGWEQLRIWVRDSGEALSLIRRLTQAHAEWVRGGQAVGLLWHDDPRLAAAEHLERDGLSRGENAFVAASVRRRRRRRNARFAITALVGSVLATAAGVSYVLRGKAVASATEARGNLARSDFAASYEAAEQLADPRTALLLAAKAAAEAPSGERDTYVLRAMDLAGAAPRLVAHLQGPLAWCVVSADGKHALALGARGVGLWDLVTGEEVAVPSDSPPSTGALLDDGTWALAFEYADHAEVRVGSAELSLEGAGAVDDLAFAPDGHSLVVARGASPWQYTLVHLDGKPRSENLTASLTPNGTAIERPLQVRSGHLMHFGGKRVAVVGKDPTTQQDIVKVIDLATGATVGQPVVADQPIADVALSQDGEVLAELGSGSRAMACDLTLTRVSTGTPVTPEPVPYQCPARIAGMTGDASRVYVTTQVPMMRLGDDRMTFTSLDEPAQLYVWGQARPFGVNLEGQLAERGLTTTRDGHIITIGRDYRVRVWDGATGQMLRAPAWYASTSGRSVSELAESELDLRVSDAGALVGVTRAGTIMQWDLRDGAERDRTETLDRGAFAAAAALSDDGGTVAVAGQIPFSPSSDRVVIARDGTPPRAIVVAGATRLALSAHGDTLAVVTAASTPNAVEIARWDLSAEPRNVCTTAPFDANPLVRVVIDGDHLIAASEGGDRLHVFTDRCESVADIPLTAAFVGFAGDREHALANVIDATGVHLTVRSWRDPAHVMSLPIEDRSGLQEVLVIRLLERASRMDVASSGLVAWLGNARIEMQPGDSGTIAVDPTRGVIVNPALAVGLPSAFPIFSASGRWLALTQPDAQRGVRVLVFDTSLGLLVASSEWATAPSAAGFDSNDRLVTIDAAGAVSRWTFRTPVADDTSWIERLGEATTGFRLGAGREELRIPMSEYRVLRERFFDDAERAAAAGDQVASRIVKRFQPYPWKRAR